MLRIVSSEFAVSDLTLSTSPVSKTSFPAKASTVNPVGSGMSFR